MLVLALSGWITYRFGSPAAATSASSTQPAAGAQASAPLPVDERVRAELPRLQEFVRRARGLDFREPVEVEVLADREFRAELRRGRMSSGGIGSGATGGTLEALGLVEDPARFDSSGEDLLEESTLGFYDPASDRLVVRGSEWTPLLESTLVHELVHALQDQRFPGVFDWAVGDGDELAFALAAVIEGDATAVEDDYYRHQTQDWRGGLDELWETEAAALGPGTSGAPAASRLRAARPRLAGDDLGRALADSLAAAPYVLGADFITEVTAWGGQAARDRAFIDPPRTSEQVLSPQAWVQRASWLEPQLVLLPEARGRQVDSGVMGAFGLALLAAEGDLEEEGAQFDGWAGDRYVTTVAGGRRCTDVDVVFDRAGQRAAAARALAGWDARRGTRLSRPRERTLRLHSCA